MADYLSPLGTDWPTKYGMAPAAWHSLVIHSIRLGQRIAVGDRPCHRHIDPPQAECNRPTRR